MDDRDQLADLIGDVAWPSSWDEETHRTIADAILAAGWHHHAPICPPGEHVMYEHCGMCGEIPEAIKSGP